MMSVAEQPTTRRLTYQPALDGLRAVAVAVVLLYHQHALGIPGIFRGGFIGVDIFFVLSGYLITRLLLDERAESGTIRLGRFWTRRFRRLMPALIAMLVVVAVLDRLAYPTAVQSIVRDDVLWVLGYAENWHIIYWFGSPISPLSHTWSLAVEEQWYLLWPVGLWLSLRVARGRLRPLLVGALGLALASAIFTYSLRDDSGIRVFYGTDTRAQQLLIGAALALWTAVSARDPQRRIGTRLNVLGLLAFGALVGIATLATNGQGWATGGYLGIAVLVAFVIAQTNRAGSWVQSILSIAPLVWIGRVSYGLYLFHFPIFRWLNPELTGLSGLALFGVRIAVTGGVVAASFFLIEQPIRRSQRVGFPVLAGGAIAVVGVLLATSMGVAPSIGRPRSALLSYVLPVERSKTPAGLQRVLVVGGAAVGELSIQQRGPYLGAGIQGLALGVLGCGLTSRHHRCLEVSGDVPALNAAYLPRWLVIVPDGLDIDAFSKTSTRSTASRRLDDSLRGARRAGVVVLLDACPVPAARVGVQRIRSWADGRNIRVVMRGAGSVCAPTSIPRGLTWADVHAAIGPR